MPHPHFTRIEEKMRSNFKLAALSVLGALSISPTASSLSPVGGCTNPATAVAFNGDGTNPKRLSALNTPAVSSSFTNLWQLKVDCNHYAAGTKARLKLYSSATGGPYNLYGQILGAGAALRGSSLAVVLLLP